MLLRNARVISPADSIDDILDINIEDGIIIDIAKNIPDNGSEVIDFPDKIITPGFVEMHCHLREPGFEYKETIETGSIAAQNGGYVAICPMANTHPVADSPEIIKLEIEKAAAIEKVKLLPIAAASYGLQGEKLTDFKALKNAGAVAFSDDGKPFVNMELFKKALKSQELIISHAEDESNEVEQEIQAFREVGGKLHFAHISTKKSLDLIKKAKQEGLNVTCETAPHYFTFTENDVTENGRFKMNPPLRKEEDRLAVIEALKDGTIDCIATDHAPHSLEEKQKPFAESPFGIIGFETALGVSLKLVEQGHLSMNQLIEKLSVNPAKILNLKDLGHIKIGIPANLTVIMPNCKYTVDSKYFQSKCKISPFEGMELQGISIATVLDGKLILKEE